MPIGGNVKQTICPVIVTVTDVSFLTLKPTTVQVPEISFNAP